jgi:hypothetical protein
MALGLGCAPCAAGDGRTATAETWLDRWATASKSVPEPDLDQYSDRYSDEYPEPVLKYMAAFFGPVERQGLETLFRWSIVESDETEVRLRATPRAHDTLATVPASAASNGAANPAAAMAETSSLLAFDIVLDQEMKRPRFVHWLGPAEKKPREAVARLTPIEDPDDGRFFAEFLHERDGGVRQASATSSSTEWQAADPSLQQALSRWEKAVSEIKSVEIQFKRFDRDYVFDLETRGVGKFVFVAPNRGLYSLKAAPVVEKAEGPASAGGGKLAVAAAKPQLYWWSGENVTIVDEREKSYDTLPIPRSLNSTIQTVGSWDVIWQVLAGPQKALPGVVDIRAEKLLTRFEWSLQENSETQVWLEGTPRTAQDRRHIKRLSVTLDPKTYRTTATRLVDPSGARETAHYFQYVRLNDSALENEDLWKPNLEAMSPLGPPPLAPAVDDLPGAPLPN